MTLSRNSYSLVKIVSVIITFIVYYLTSVITFGLIVRVVLVFEIKLGSEPLS
jgi:hypothetical protein